MQHLAGCVNRRIRLNWRIENLNVCIKMGYDEFELILELADFGEGGLFSTAGNCYHCQA